MLASLVRLWNSEFFTMRMVAWLSQKRSVGMYLVILSQLANAEARKLLLLWQATRYSDSVVSLDVQVCLWLNYVMGPLLPILGFSIVSIHSIICIWICKKFIDFTSAWKTNPIFCDPFKISHDSMNNSTMNPF